MYQRSTYTISSTCCTFIDTRTPIYPHDLQRNQGVLTLSPYNCRISLFAVVTSFIYTSILTISDHNFNNFNNFNKLLNNEHRLYIHYDHDFRVLTTSSSSEHLLLKSMHVHQLSKSVHVRHHHLHAYEVHARREMTMTMTSS
jgi:hypothetical protein